MNNPEYILVDVFKEIAAAIAIKLNMNINYQFGYIKELNETLIAYAKTSEFRVKKFPLIWVAPSFGIRRGDLSYGKTSGLKIFILQNSTIDDKYAKRLEVTYKPVIMPIYRELLNQIDKHPAFMTISAQRIKHDYEDYPYWGENQKTVLNDVVDCRRLFNIELVINNNKNCSTT